MSNADELLKLKDLLDAGVLSQEEFDLEKQKLLTGQSQEPKPEAQKDPPLKPEAQKDPPPMFDPETGNFSPGCLLMIFIFFLIFFGWIMFFEPFKGPDLCKEECDCLRAKGLADFDCEADCKELLELGQFTNCRSL